MNYYYQMVSEWKKIFLLYFCLLGDYYPLTCPSHFFFNGKSFEGHFGLCYLLNFHSYLQLSFALGNLHCNHASLRFPSLSFNTSLSLFYSYLSLSLPILDSVCPIQPLSLLLLLFKDHKVEVRLLNLLRQMRPSGPLGTLGTSTSPYPSIWSWVFRHWH